VAEYFENDNHYINAPLHDCGSRATWVRQNHLDLSMLDQSVNRVMGECANFIGLGAKIAK
jgi:hypothetical protein